MLFLKFYDFYQVLSDLNKNICIVLAFSTDPMSICKKHLCFINLKKSIVKNILQRNSIYVLKHFCLFLPLYINILLLSISIHRWHLSNQVV